MPPNNLPVKKPAWLELEEERARRLILDWPLCDACNGDGFVDATMGQDPYDVMADCVKCQRTGLMEPEVIPGSEQLERRWEIKQ